MGLFRLALRKRDSYNLWVIASSACPEKKGFQNL